MKKFLIVVFLLALVLLACNKPASADLVPTPVTPTTGALSTRVGGVDGVDFGLIDAQGGLYYDFESSRLYGGLEATVASWKNLLSIGAGGLTNGSKQAFLGGIHGNINTVCQKFGWEYKLPVDVQIGVFGAANLNYEQDEVNKDNPSRKYFWGICASVVKKF